MSEEANTNFNVNGYIFETKTEFDRANKEFQVCKIIRQKLEFAAPEKILMIYNKLIEEKLLETPVGLEFLMEIRNHLIATQTIPKDKIYDIPVPSKVDKLETAKTENIDEIVDNKKRKNQISKEEKVYRGRFITALVIIFALIGVIIAMFYISNSSENITILNYKEQIINQYEQWEADLNEREQVIREYEEKYGIE